MVVVIAKATFCVCLGERVPWNFFVKHLLG